MRTNYFVRICIRFHDKLNSLTININYCLLNASLAQGGTNLIKEQIRVSLFSNTLSLPLIQIYYHSTTGFSRLLSILNFEFLWMDNIAFLKLFLSGALNNNNPALSQMPERQTHRWYPGQALVFLPLKHPANRLMM